MATDRSMPSPDLAMSPSTNDSPYTTKMKTALRNANPTLADTLLQVLDPPRKPSHTTRVWLCVRVCACASPPHPSQPSHPSYPLPSSHPFPPSPPRPPSAPIGCVGRCVGVRACVCVHTYPLVPYGGGTIRGGQGSSAGSGHRMWGHAGPLPPKPPPPPPHNPGTLRWHAGARDGRAGGRGTNLIGCVG